MIRKAFFLCVIFCYSSVYSGNSLGCIQLTDDDKDVNAVALYGEDAKRVVFNALVSFDVNFDIKQFNRDTGLQVQKDDAGMKYCPNEQTQVFYELSQFGNQKQQFVDQLDYAALLTVINHKQLLHQKSGNDL